MKQSEKYVKIFVCHNYLKLRSFWDHDCFLRDSINFLIFKYVLIFASNPFLILVLKYPRFLEYANSDINCDTNLATPIHLE